MCERRADSPRECGQKRDRRGRKGPIRSFVRSFLRSWHTGRGVRVARSCLIFALVRSFLTGCPSTEGYECRRDHDFVRENHSDSFLAYSHLFEPNMLGYSGNRRIGKKKTEIAESQSMISIFLFLLSHVGYIINEQLIANIFARESDLCELLIFENGIKNKLCIYDTRCDTHPCKRGFFTFRRNALKINGSFEREDRWAGEFKREILTRQIDTIASVRLPESD